MRREETIMRLGGEGDNFPMTWAADDRQLVTVDDGWGWIEHPGNLYNNRLFAITGDPRGATFSEIASYPEEPIWGSKATYHGFGTLAVDGKLYQYLSSMFDAVKLIYSPDGGRTWCNQHGSSPVVWELKEQQSAETMLFFDEPQKAFSLLSVLQMGRDYGLNRDGYVYIYGPNGITEGTMNELVMFRVHKNRIRERSAFEYFGGLHESAAAHWTKDMHGRKPVHTFPRGWVNTSLHPMAWIPSVTYNAPLGLYMMTNWGMGAGIDGKWFSKPTYLGFWIAQNPWGPWTQIHEETAWLPNGDPAARAYSPQIAPKWISKDGRSLWLVWTDWQQTSEFWPLMLKAMGSASAEECVRLMQKAKAYRPYYGLNTQRVDLVIA